MAEIPVYNNPVPETGNYLCCYHADYRFIYDTAFDRFKMGYASAAAYIFFLILIVLTVMQKRILMGEED